jgi:hypothetical protein
MMLFHSSLSCVVEGDDSVDDDPSMIAWYEIKYGKYYPARKSRPAA